MKRLLPLKVGDLIRIQNQTGPYPRKWDKNGTVIEVYQYDQYVVCIDGSDRITLFLAIKSFYASIHPCILPLKSNPQSRT
jgi:hypothetical protein